MCKVCLSLFLIKKMTSRNYKSWSKTSNEAKELSTKFALFDSSNGTQGVNPKLGGEELKQLYESTPSLHKYNPRYFRQNFKNLVAAWELNKSLTTGRSKYIFNSFIYFISISIRCLIYQLFLFRGRR